jgi:hypothetical protein
MIEGSSMVTPSVVVDDLNVLGTRSRPSEADSPLLIDSDAVLALSVASELLQSISGRHSKVI